MDFKPNKYNLVLTFLGLLIGYFAFYAIIGPCSYLMRDDPLRAQCLADFHFNATLMTLAIGIMGYLIGSLIAKKKVK